MKISIYKSKEGGYTTDKNNASEFLFEVELGEKWYCVALYDVINNRMVLDYNANIKEWNYTKLLYEASNALQRDLDFNYEENEGVGLEEYECTMFLCWVNEREAGQYFVEVVPNRTATVRYEE